MSLRPGDLFLDVGANVGTSTTLLASGVSRANIIAVEPIPATFDRVMRNIRLNQLTGYVNALLFAVGASQGSVQLTAYSDAQNRAV